MPKDTAQVEQPDVNLTGQDPDVNTGERSNENQQQSFADLLKNKAFASEFDKRGQGQSQ